MGEGGEGQITIRMRNAGVEEKKMSLRKIQK